MVHYRIGSLEKHIDQQKYRPEVHYRIGSLEKSRVGNFFIWNVHYRIGSLEIKHHLIYLE